eukprot:1152577-Pelagomonas_calceolata.AAC.2
MEVSFVEVLQQLQDLMHHRNGEKKRRTTPCTHDSRWCNLGRGKVQIMSVRAESNALGVGVAVH